MQIPSAGFVEVGFDALRKKDATILADETRELKQALGANVSAEFTNGYLLGLEVARAILATQPLLPLKGVDADSLL